MKKMIAALSLAAVMAVSLVACGNDTSSSAPTPASEPASVSTPVESTPESTPAESTPAESTPAESTPAESESVA